MKKRIPILRFAAILSSCILAMHTLCVGSASAATYAINSDPADATIGNNTGSPAIVTTTDFASRIGEYFSPGVSISVLPFLLPTLAVGEQFTDADLRLQLYSLDNGNLGLGNVDLYGLGARASATVLTSDFYAGNATDSTPGVTLIQSDFLTPSSTVRTDATTGPFINPSPAGIAALVSYLNTQYNGGAGAGQYVFLRLSYDQNPSVAGNNSYQILTDDAGGANEKPLLTLTSAAIPEPSVYALILTGAAGLLVFRRFRRA